MFQEIYFSYQDIMLMPNKRRAIFVTLAKERAKYIESKTPIK